MLAAQSSLTTLALELAAGPCACDLRSPSGMVSFCPGTRQTRFHRKPGETVTCTRCLTRRALEADGVLPPEVPLDRGGFLCFSMSSTSSGP